MVAIKRRAEVEAEGMRLDSTFAKLKSEELAHAAIQAGGTSVAQSPPAGGTEASHTIFEAQRMFPGRQRVKTRRSHGSSRISPFRSAALQHCGA